MTLSRRLVLWTTLSLLVFASIATGQNGETKVDPYSNAHAIIYLIECDHTLIDGTEAIEATTPRMFGFFYNANNNRLVILGDDDGKKEIPAFSAAHLAAFQSSFIPVINQDGDIDSTYLETTSNPLVDIGVSFPQGVKWPVDNAQTGNVMGVTGLVAELARDGVTNVNRATLAWLTVPHRLENSVYIGNMNVGTKQDFFLPAAGEKWVVDYVEVFGASTSLTTVQFSMGQNANADDWVATDAYTELVDDTVSTTIYPMRGKKIITNSSAFGVKCTTLQGAAATLKFELIGHRLE